MIHPFFGTFSPSHMFLYSPRLYGFAQKSNLLFLGTTLFSTVRGPLRRFLKNSIVVWFVHISSMWKAHRMNTDTPRQRLVTIKKNKSFSLKYGFKLN